LTGLPNRQLFFDRLAQGLNAARAEGRELAVMIIDVQGFKRVNDTLGRHAGDRVLPKRRCSGRSEPPRRAKRSSRATILQRVSQTTSPFDGFPIDRAEGGS
jgi:predicted signal transduction protein with EAL and GGDEF domain